MGFQRVVQGQEQGDHHHGVLEGGTQNQLAPLNHRSLNFQIAKASVLSLWIGQGFRCGESWSLAAVSDEHGESPELGLGLLSSMLHSVQAECRDFFEVCRWGNAGICTFNRLIYGNGTWLTRAQAKLACSSCWDSLEARLSLRDTECRSEEAYAVAARLSRDRGWRLFYMRPKIHMMGHIVLLGLESREQPDRSGHRWKTC